jgi:hypothetical protein
MFSRLDTDSLAAWFRLGTFLNERTAFNGVRVRNVPVILTRPLDLSRAQVIEGYIDLFRQAIGRMSGDAVVTLSGGRDSRHILLELIRSARKPVFAITAMFFPPTRSADAPVASEICARADIKHIVVSQGDRFAAEWQKNQLTNFSASEHAWVIALRPYLAGRTVFDGIGGDVLSAGLLQSRRLIELFRSDRDQLAEELLKSSPIDMIFPGVFPRNSALVLLRAELERYKDAVNPLAAFIFWNRTMRYIATSPLGAERVLTPYLDPDLFQFLCRIPPEYTWDHALHTDVINRAYPEWSNLPYATSFQDAPRRSCSARLALKALLHCCDVRPTYFVPRLLSGLSGSHNHDWAAILCIYLKQLLAADPAQHGSDIRFVSEIQGISAS